MDFCYDLRLATRWVGFLQKAQNNKVSCHTKFAEQSEASQSPCHTERSEVSTQNTENGLPKTEH